MKEIRLEEFKNNENYKKFIKYMLSKSEYFSLVYFRYRENEPMKKKTKDISDLLKKLKVYSEYTLKWPGTETRDTEHFYKIVFYRSEQEAEKALTMVDDIFDWYYPNAPMDLCFYRDGYCWYESTCHEGDATVYTEEQKEIDDIKEMNANIIWCGDFGHTPFMLNKNKF